MDGTILNKKYSLEERVKALEEGGGGGYVLPVATDETLGGVKIGSNLSIDAKGVLNNNLIKYGTCSGVTSESGLLTPKEPINKQTKIVVSAYGGASHGVLPIAAASDNTWRFMIFVPNTITPLVNGEITVYYAYVENES